VAPSTAVSGLWLLGAAGLVVAVGAARTAWGVERMLARKSFQFLAAISFPLCTCGTGRSSRSPTRAAA
jgi:hypothetical protein